MSGPSFDFTVPPAAAPLVAGVREFLEREIRPIEAELAFVMEDERRHLTEEGRLIPEVVAAKDRIRVLAAKAGYYAAQMPTELGGLGLGPLDLMYLQEEVYRDGLKLMKEVLAWTEGPNLALLCLDEEQRRRYLLPMIRGEVTAAVAITEPVAGSDATAIETTATRDGDDWVLNGHKVFITNAPFANFAFVIAKTQPAAGKRGMTAFIVDRDTPGYQVGRMNTTLIEDGNTAELHFESCRVPAANVVGSVGQGLYFFLAWINNRRLGRGGMCAGLGRFCFERALAYARRRTAFGHRIGDWQAVQWMLVDSYVDIYAARALSASCLAEITSEDLSTFKPRPEVIRKIAMVKVFNDETLYRVADRAIQVHGALGLTKSLHLEKIFRVARNLRIPAGTTEMQRINIAKTLGLG
ncbi:MAG: acyl-CoA dehydrogenase [Chloroflexi bacterium]|nr:acyl-CoA dehydrogenase [Chloroflexota bacterium]